MRKVTPAERLFDNEVTLLIRDDEDDPTIPRREFELTFRRVRGIRLLIDLIAKSMARDSIFYAGELRLADHPELADPFEDWASPLVPSKPDDSVPRLFVVELTPTGGTIHILADEAVLQERQF